MANKIIQANSPVLAIATSVYPYEASRKIIQRLASDHKLRVADLPMIIQAMTNPDVRTGLRPYYVDSITGEYHGRRDGERSYETWHSAGSLSTVRGLRAGFTKRKGRYGFMSIMKDEWLAVGKENYLGKDIERLHLVDVKKDDVPDAGTPHTIFVRLDKDNFTINESGKLKYDAFMRDDRVLMLSGSLENREALAKLFFGGKREGGEKLPLVGNYHRINDVKFTTRARGRLVALGICDQGLKGGAFSDKHGSFAAVSDRVINNGAAGVTLEKTLSIISDYNLDRKGMAKAVTELYRKIGDPR